MRTAQLAAVFMSLAAPAAAGVPVFNLPLECEPGVDCFIQNYIDADPGAGAADYTCGPLTYDGHKGVDLAIPDMAAMKRGVNVIAAAPGTVTKVRNFVPDRRSPSDPLSDMNGRECGNGVEISHGGGWTSKYCHMKQYSITMRQGEKVAKGTVMGQVGLSGRTQFPHVHMSVYKDGNLVDPFNPSGIVSCDPRPASDSLWQDPPAYLPGGIVNMGTTSKLPKFEAARMGMVQASSFPADAPMLVLWVQAFGVRDGDRLEMKILGPGGPVIDDVVDLTREQARAFRYLGKRQTETTPSFWPSGDYVSSVRHMRGDSEIDYREQRFTIGD